MCSVSAGEEVKCPNKRSDQPGTMHTPRTSPLTAEALLLLGQLLWLVSAAPAAPVPGCTAPELLPGQPFVVVWNIPSFVCGHIDFNLSAHGILANPGNQFFGEYMNTFYSLGDWPSIDKNGTDHNGGLPQLVNMTAHLEKVRRDVERLVPNASHPGLGVIDQEKWRPLFDFNWSSFGKYWHRSIALVQQQHPDWTDKKTIQDETARQFNKAARELMLGTLQLAQRLRPKIKWGYYGFPNCHQSCNPSMRSGNDRVAWMFNGSSGLFPSIYFRANGTGPEGDSAKRNSVAMTIKETIRVHARYSHPEVPVIPFTLIQNEPLKFFSPHNLQFALREPAELGVGGVVLWGSSSSFHAPHACQALRHYVTSVLGPYVRRLTGRASLCSQQRCSGHGRCISNRYEREFQVQYVQHNTSHACRYDRRALRSLRARLDSSRHSKRGQSPSGHRGPAEEAASIRVSQSGAAAPFADYSCRCYPGWTGKDCSIQHDGQTPHVFG